MNWTAVCDIDIGIYHRDWQHLFIVLDSVLAIVSIVGNSFVLISIWRTPRLHSPSNVLLAGLALTDLGVGLVCQPARIVAAVMSLASKMRDKCIVDRALTLVIVFTSYFFAGVSLLILIAVTVDRYLALRLHLRYSELVTDKRVLVLLLSIWTVSVLNSAVWALTKFFSYIFSCSFILIFISVTVWCNFKIFKTIRRHQVHMQAQAVAGPNLPNVARYKKSVFNMMYIIGMSMISYIPWFVAAILNFVRPLSHTTWHTVVTLFFLNSCFNPVLYCWRMGELRQAIMEMVKCNSS